MPRARKVCSTPRCPETVPAGTGRCDDCQAKAEQRRGSAASRGYDHRHRTAFRSVVLERDPICKRCSRRPSKHADHYPLDRRELVRRGMNPNDPRHGRGLCHSCHSRETATNQPGGWHAG